LTDELTHSDVIAGVTEGAINAGTKGAKAFAQKIMDGNLGFIQDRATINLVKEMKKMPEYELYSQFIKDKELLRQALMGITLRTLEKDNSWDQLMDLRARISSKYRKRGINTASFVQNQLLNKIVAKLVATQYTEKEIIVIISEVMSQVTNYCIFLQKIHDKKIIGRMLQTKMSMCLPVIVISASGRVVKDATELIKKIRHEQMDYRRFIEVEDTTVKKKGKEPRKIKKITVLYILD